MPLRTVVREWGRIGCIGFGGPPAHIALLRELCVERRGWLSAREFEDAIAACNLLPGPGLHAARRSSARGACAGRPGALVGGLALHPARPGRDPRARRRCSWPARRRDVVRGAGAGAGAAVAAVAVQAGIALLRPSLAARGGRPRRWIAYVARRRARRRDASGRGSCSCCSRAGALELALRRPRPHAASTPGRSLAPPLAGGGRRARLDAFKVGALSYGGGFVIVPLMQADAVERHHWMTDGAVPERRRARPGHAGPGRAHGRGRRLRGGGLGGGAARGGRRVRAVVRVRPARRPAASTGCGRRRAPAPSSTAPGRRRSARSSARRSRSRAR